jgi:hypothetical protein
MQLRFVIIMLFAIPIISKAQLALRGMTYTAKGGHVLAGVSIANLNSRIAQMSSEDGSYSILVREGDKVTFFSIGYKVDTVKVSEGMLRFGYDDYLTEQIVTLDPVRVFSDYRHDSIERKNYYDKIYHTETRITGGNTPQYGFGIVLSPVSYFSKEKNETRRLKKKLKNDEQNFYIDAVFPPAFVSSITGLRGDTLLNFMYRYRPSYKYCRAHNRTDMILYINDRYKDYMNTGSKRRR